MNIDFILYIVLFLGCLFVITSILIVRELVKREIKINYLFIRLFIFKYVKQYKEITTKESGKPGSLYFFWIAVINLELILFLVWLALKFII